MPSVQFLWKSAGRIGSFRTGVCLHGHTMHSEECLNFLPRYLRRVPGVSRLVSRYERGPRKVDFSRAWWTPPLTPACAMRLERTQLAGLGLHPIVSLTDHDNIEAGLALQSSGDPPVSVEWTVPYHRSVFHLGIHNLPPAAARGWMSAMASYTAEPEGRELPGILRELAAMPEVLIVLNHPFWLEQGIDETDHGRALDILRRECQPWLHALELNGTRLWRENARVVELAQQWSRPLISGGDRHACEPAACVNLTNAGSFDEFADEVRGGRSRVLFMPQYREPMPLRLMETVWDILRPYPEYPGRELWTDRLFYRGADEVAHSLSALWASGQYRGMPWMIPPVVGTVQFFVTSQARMALRMLLSKRAEVMP